MNEMTPQEQQQDREPDMASAYEAARLKKQGMTWDDIAGTLRVRGSKSREVLTGPGLRSLVVRLLGAESAPLVRAPVEKPRSAAAEDEKLLEQIRYLGSIDRFSASERLGLIRSMLLK